MQRFARAVIMDDQQRFLMVHNTSKNRNRWEFPGGKVEGQEDEHVTALRELSEETGVFGLVPIVRINGLPIKTFADCGEWEGYFFHLPNWAGEPTIQEPEKFDQLRWVTVEEMSGLPQIPRLGVDIARLLLQQLAAHAGHSGTG